MAIIPPAPLKLSKKDLLIGLLQHNYFPHQHDDKEELPPIFSSTKFTTQIAQKLLASKCRKEGYDILPYRRTRHPNIPRIMGIPHPRAYAELVFKIAENWDSHIAELCQSPNSEIGFEKHDDGRIIVQKYNRIDPDGDSADESPLTNFGKQFRLKTDITNFFHSIYSHSLPWALVGHKVAKKEREDSKWFNAIDGAVRSCQRGETKGVPIGPATSNLLSEIILDKVDKAMCAHGFEFSRYIDDYKVYTKTSEEAGKFLVLLSEELGKYSLNLNPRKTVISKLPVPDKDDWVGEINLFLGVGKPKPTGGKKSEKTDNKLSFRQIKLVINKAVSLSNQYPDGSILKYTLSAIINHGVEGREAETFLHDAILRYAFYFPTIIPLIQRAYDLPTKFDQYPQIQARLLELLRKSLQDAQSDNIVWCLYYLRKSAAELEPEDWNRIWASNDPMVMLMGYVFAKKNKLSFDVLIKWADGQIAELKSGELNEYDLDRFWLVFYQLYFDDLIEVPYKEDADNAVFVVLKKRAVSFINFEHADFRTLTEISFSEVNLSNFI